MKPRFPIQTQHKVPQDPAKMASTIGALAETGAFSQGCVCATTDTGVFYLFVRGDRGLGAGAYEDGTFSSIPVGTFFDAAARGGNVVLHAFDLPLFVAMGVLFREKPIASIGSDYLNAANLLLRIRQNTRNSVLVLRRGAAHNLVFCWTGEPAILYPAEHEFFPGEATATVSDRLGRYLEQDGVTDTIIDFYDGHTTTSTEEGRPLSSLLPGAKADPQTGDDDLLICLVAHLGNRVIAQVPVGRHPITIGRDPENDLVLDNLAVSRLHAEARFVDGRVFIQDQWSENKLTHKGKQVSEVRLTMGESVQLSKYKLQVEHVHVDNYRPQRKVRTADSAMRETYAISSSPVVGSLVYRGDTHKIRGMVFTVGTSQNANLQVDGFFIAPLHLRVIKTPEGRFQLQHAAGRRRVRVNGAVVTEHFLKAGDVINLGRHELAFDVALRATSSAATQADALGPRDG